MFISRKTYDDLRLNEAKARGQAAELAQERAQLVTTVDWLRIRVTQIEKERAQLLYLYTGVKVPVPEIARMSETPSSPLHATPNFDDVGDAEALRLGIGYNEDGTLKYAPLTA